MHLFIYFPYNPNLFLAQQNNRWSKLSVPIGCHQQHHDTLSCDVITSPTLNCADLCCVFETEAAIKFSVQLSSDTWHWAGGWQSLQLSGSIQTSVHLCPPPSWRRLLPAGQHKQGFYRVLLTSYVHTMWCLMSFHTTPSNSWITFEVLKWVLKLVIGETIQTVKRFPRTCTKTTTTATKNPGRISAPGF